MAQPGPARRTFVVLIDCPIHMLRWLLGVAFDHGRSNAKFLVESPHGVDLQWPGNRSAMRHVRDRDQTRRLRARPALAGRGSPGLGALAKTPEDGLGGTIAALSAWRRLNRWTLSGRIRRVAGEARARGSGRPTIDAGFMQRGGFDLRASLVVLHSSQDDPSFCCRDTARRL